MIKWIKSWYEPRDVYYVDWTKAKTVKDIVTIFDAAIGLEMNKKYMEDHPEFKKYCKLRK